MITGVALNERRKAMKGDEERRTLGESKVLLGYSQVNREGGSE